MKITVSTESIEDLNCESMILGFFSDERPPKGYCGDVDWCFNGLISHLIARGRIEGTSMERVLFSSDRRLPASWILLFGLGEKKSLDYSTLRHAGGALLRTAHDMGCRDFAFDIPGAGRCSLDTTLMTESFLRGMGDVLHEEDTAGMSACILGRNSIIEEIYQGIETIEDLPGTDIVVPVVKRRRPAQDGAPCE